MIKWATNKEDTDLVVKIARRAIAMAEEKNNQYEQITAVMDITDCQNNGAPLKLQELLDADSFNFAHDVFGIRRHIDRHTGHLQNCFLPRYSK